jgi:hypothetical protein
MMTIRRGLLWLVAIALVIAQGLGLVHRVVHGPQAGIAFAVAAKDAHEDDGHDHHHGHDHGWLAALFSGHDDGTGTCRLFDAVGSHIAPAVAALALPALLPPLFFQWAEGEALVRWAALFDARGPPSIR